MAKNSKEEPRNAPQPDRWYNLTLGPSYHHSSNKFCTLRYEFKPASIDKSKPGKLQKTKENRVSVEFQNNQIGKPKVAFEGSTEDYKDNDAVLFFDGETFRLERLHRAVKQLRHVRQPGESAAAAHSLDADPVLSPPVGRGAKLPLPTITTFNPVPIEVERIDIGEPQTSGAKPSDKRVVDQFFESPRRSLASVAASPEQKNDETEENHDIDVNELFGGAISDYEDDNHNNNEEEERKDNPELDNDDDMNVSHQNDSDEEIADVDDSGDEGKGQNAADALRAQLNAAAEKQPTSSSSSSSSGSESDSGSSSSSSSSSSSGSEAASGDDETVNSV